MNGNLSESPAPPDSRPTEVPWTFRSAILAVLLLLLASLLVSVVIAIIHGLETGIVDVMILGIIAPVMMLFAVWWVGIKGNPAWVVNLGLKAPKWSTAVGVVVVTQLAVFGFTLFYSLIIRRLGIVDLSQERILRLFISNRQDLLISLLLISVLAPVTEELMFRGIVFKSLRGNMGLGAAAAISGCVFAFSHLSPVTFVPLAVMGALLAVIYEKTGSLATPVMLHSLNNTVALLIFYYTR